MKCIQRLLPYLLCAAFVMGWWFIAFSYPNKKLDHLTEVPASSHLLASREMLHQALSGDIDLMISLVSRWDKDLSQEMQTLKDQMPECTANNIRILPQSHSAASFVLALTKPEQIVAIPYELRKQTQLFCPAITSQIPDDIGSCSREKLYLLHPHISFVATYSNPAIVQTLLDQGIEVAYLKNIQNFSDIQQALLEVGQRLGHAIKAKILAIFMEAAVRTMKKQLQIAQISSTEELKILYLNFHGRYCTPTQKTVLGQFFASLRINEQFHSANPKHQFLWRTPLTQEQIVNYKPEYLILSTSSKEDALQIFQEPAFAELPAVKKTQVYFVDEVVQESLSQYTVLAYFDLYQILLNACGA